MPTKPPHPHPRPFVNEPKIKGKIPIQETNKADTGPCHYELILFSYAQTKPSSLWLFKAKTKTSVTHV